MEPLLAPEGKYDALSLSCRALSCRPPTGEGARPGRALPGPGGARGGFPMAPGGKPAECRDGGGGLLELGMLGMLGGTPDPGTDPVAGRFACSSLSIRRISACTNGRCTMSPVEGLMFRSLFSRSPQSCLISPE